METDSLGLPFVCVVHYAASPGQFCWITKGSTVDTITKDSWGVDWEGRRRKGRRSIASSVRKWVEWQFHAIYSSSIECF